MNSSPTPAKGELPLNRTIASATAEAGRTAPKGLCELSDAEQELDSAIRELGQKMVQADQDGDPRGRDIFASRMYTAIRSRTPEHQARLLAEVDRRIDELTFAGDWAHAGSGR